MNYLALGVSAAIWAAVSYLYHPTLGTIIAGSVIGLALTALIFWSSSRIPSGKRWVLKILAISTVAGLMNSTALDVAYSLLSAPLGNRFNIGIEMVATGLILTGLAVLNVSFGTKKND